MPYVERDEAGRIKGVYANPQPGYAEEYDEDAVLERPEPADILPLILGGLHERIVALETKSDGEITHILTTSGDPPADMVAEAYEEDPGEQPEIFTEEDVEALGAVAVEGEASEDAADDAGSAENASSPPVGDTANVSEDRQPAYPGVALLPDELGARRNAVLAAITTEKLTRLSVAMDPSRADFLAARFAEYQNAGALGLAIDDALAADSRAFQELRDRRDRITNYAMQLEQSALDGDMDRLSAMHAGLGDGWP